MIGFINAFSHFLVDWACVSAVFASGAAGEKLFYAILVYDTLAFSTQCVFGLLLDRIRPARGKDQTWLFGMIEAGGMGLVAIGAGVLTSLSLTGMQLGASLMACICLIGLGNSLFHVAGGIVTYKKSGGKAAPLGIFVAPGAFGVTLGTLFPQFSWLAVVLLGIACVSGLTFYTMLRRKDENDGTEANAPDAESLQSASEERFPTLCVVLLTAAVAVRAIGGCAVRFSWKTGAAAALILTFFVFLGKSLGGFVCDRTDAAKMAAVTIPAAAVLTAFLSGSMAASLIGQMLINLSMPVTLWLLHRLLPKEPGLAFGLAASALWPGTAAGLLIELTGPARQILIIISFLFGTFAIIYAEHYRRKS